MRTSRYLVILSSVQYSDFEADLPKSWLSYLSLFHVSWNTNVATSKKLNTLREIEHDNRNFQNILIEKKVMAELKTGDQNFRKSDFKPNRQVFLVLSRNDRIVCRNHTLTYLLPRKSFLGESKRRVQEYGLSERVQSVMMFETLKNLKNYAVSRKFLIGSLQKLKFSRAL